MTSTPRTRFVERSAQPRARSVPLAHMSVELGHLYMEDLLAGPQRLRALFAEARPWAEAAMGAAVHGASASRVSTCFLVDDYFATPKSPAQVIPELLEAAASAGLTVDYLARESACARLGPGPGSASPAELVVGRLVAEPVQGVTGERPAATASGWLTNGQRSPDLSSLDAMDVDEIVWEPPVQAAARNHSIFVDVELWKKRDDGSRLWSCALLASVWQLLRLGLVRDAGMPLAEPAAPPGNWPDRWDQLSPVIRLTERPAPFQAYRTVSILSPRFLPVELAVRTILSQVGHDPAVLAQIAARAAGEKVPLPPDVLDRIGYVFAGSGDVDPA